MRGPSPIDYGWWLASRSAGIVALLAVSASVLAGLLMANGLPRRRGAKKRLLALHESSALAGLLAISLHGVLLLGDGWLRPGLAGITIPFAMDYRPAFTGLGILAGWGAVTLGLSFYVRRHIGARLWRKLHRLTIAVWLLVVVHVLGAGTDAGQWWLQGIIVLTGVPILLLLAMRVLPPQGSSAITPRRERPEPRSAGAQRPRGAPPRSAGRAPAA